MKPFPVIALISAIIIANRTYQFTPMEWILVLGGCLFCFIYALLNLIYEQGDEQGENDEKGGEK